MRNKLDVVDIKMYVTDCKKPEFIGVSAKEMARALLTKESNGPGDTIEAAAYRAQTKYGVDAEILLQGWRREIRDMKASRWLSLFRAYWTAGLMKSGALYESERLLHEDASPITGLADFVAGKKNANG